MGRNSWESAWRAGAESSPRGIPWHEREEHVQIFPSVSKVHVWVTRQGLDVPNKSLGKRVWYAERIRMQSVRCTAEGNLPLHSQMCVLVSSGLFFLEDCKLPRLWNGADSCSRVCPLTHPWVGGVKASLGSFLTTFIHFLFRGGKEATVWEMCSSFLESFTGKGRYLDRQTDRPGDLQADKRVVCRWLITNQVWGWL